MDNLNNNQMILLAILVSFVTSIATGIFTVTLMQEAPLTVTNTINRVVERTVETVTAPVGEKETIVKERVVIEKGGELVVAAIEKASPALIPLYSLGGGDANGDAVVIQEGVGFLTKDGRLLSLFSKTSTSNLYVVDGVGEGRKIIPLSKVKEDSETTLSLFTISGESLSGEAVTFERQSLDILDTEIQVGQTAIVLGKGSVAVSFVSGLVQDEGSDPLYTLYLDSNDTLIGAPVIDVEERVIGLLVNERTLMTAETIQKFLAEEVTE